MSPVLTIASLTMREAARRRLVAAFALISIALVSLSGWGFYKLSHTPSITSGETGLAVSQAVVLFMFMFSFVVALSASAIASLAISGEIESGVLQTIVARPIRRSDVLLGKWLGLAGLLAAYTAIVCSLLVGVVAWTSGYVPPNPAAATAFVLAEGIVLLTLVLLFSTRLSALAAGVLGVALFGIAWLAGVAASLGTAFGIRGMHTAGAISQYLLPTDGLWHGAMFNLEPPSLISQQLAGPVGERAGPFAVSSAPAWPYLAWAAIWLILVLALGLISLQRREL